MMTTNDIPIRVGTGKIKLSSAVNQTDYNALPVTDFIMNNTFWVGVAQNVTVEDMKQTSEIFHNFIRENC